jgi:RNA polymerase sigma-70 factor (ECF subfamily)
VEQLDDTAFAKLIAPYRRELRAHCYRMAGSIHDADDLLQEGLLRAWRGLPGFEGRASLRTWLYKVVTHACLDRLATARARTLPIESEAGDDPFIEPCSPELYSGEPSPEARIAQRESVALAFLVALQRLTPKQRATLILRDVLGMAAAECAELLELSVAAVNSALQRAREVLAEPAAPSSASLPALDRAGESALARYIAAWEQADAHALIGLLREDATLAMPPMREWLAGASAIAGAIDDMVFRPAGAGTLRLVRTEANGEPACALYRRDAAGVYRGEAIQIVRFDGERIASITAFLDPTLFARLGLPEQL